MDCLNLDSKIWLLEIFKIALFCGLLLLAGNYMIPTGVTSIQKWIKSKEKRDLQHGVMYFSVGLMLLLYLLATSIVSHIRK